MTGIDKNQLAAAHEMLEEVLADRMVGLLNELLELDYGATVELIFGPHVPCNEALANHESVQVRELPEEHQQGERKWGFRVMGLLNGLCGTYPDGYGRISGEFDVVCSTEDCAPTEEQKGKSVVGDPCPNCGKPLELGGLHRFTRTPPEKHGAPPPPDDAVH
jgi:hypothetical protein